MTGSLSTCQQQLNYLKTNTSAGEGNGNPLQCSCLENPRDRGAWWAAVLWGRTVRHDWSDLAVAAVKLAEFLINIINSTKTIMGDKSCFSFWKIWHHNILWTTNSKVHFFMFFCLQLLLRCRCYSIRYFSEWWTETVEQIISVFSYLI